MTTETWEQEPTPAEDLPPATAGPVGIPDPPEDLGAPAPGAWTVPAGAGPAGGAEDSSSEPTTTTQRTTPSSTDDLAAGWDGDASPRRPLRLAKTLAPFLEEAVVGAGELANARAADRGGHPQQWLADANDVQIAEPLARVADRYLPAAAIGDPTVRDLLEAGLIAVRYLVKQLHLAAQWRRAKRPEVQAV